MRVAVAQHRSRKGRRRELDTSFIRFGGVDGEIIERIKGRVAQCRRLAAFMTDREVARILLQMADEAEADLKRIEASSADEPRQIIIEIDGPKTGA